ncbi:MAG TPA: hypothetical protein VL026_05225 [Rhizomicrobium sp.]|nr:hypothetical protein [Rhizomicrobium sp.]
MAIPQILMATAFAVSATSPATPHTCSRSGAYGIPFGAKPDKTAKRTEGGDASVWYAVSSPEPDPRFDKYLVRADTKTGKIFQIDAVRTIIPLDRSESTTAAEREEAKGRARAFALEFIEALPVDARQQLVDKYDSSHWEAVIAETYLEISASTAWDVTVSCRDLRREREMAQRVFPELFKPSK